MDAAEYQRLIDTVSAQISETEFFSTNTPNNDLHPDPRRLRDELVSLSYRVQKLEEQSGLRNSIKSGMHHVNGKFPAS